MIAISVSSAIANDRSESEGYAMKRKKPTHEDVFNKYGEMLRTPGLSERELKERNEEMFKMLVEVGDPRSKQHSRTGKYIFYAMILLVLLLIVLAI
ncbi:MAG: hypothetical protein H6876_04470 [Hyphomicrobiaceae bacterium]|nr:hypothetical protein [Hyphomicrobiaceae bacterium]MCC0007361.1 hypothetical protein [Hyphomicrobiaceae bacterium]